MPPVRVIPTLLLCLGFCGFAQQQGPINFDFKASDPGQPPKGWLVPSAKQGFPAVVTDKCSKPGNRCLVLRSERAVSQGEFGNLMQYFDAANYRGKQVRFRASARIERSGRTRAGLWLRVNRPDHQVGFFDNMMDRPIVSAEWATYEINGEVSEDATGVALGLLLGGEGAAYIDNISFEVTGTIEKAPLVERSRPLTGRGLENLTAFARLYGYVRHFHPSDEAARADWDALAINGARAVEDAATSNDLASKLEELFRPVAPTLRVFLASAEAPRLHLGSGARSISWKHHGFGNGSATGIYRSERVTGDAPGGALPAPLLAELGGGVRALVPMALFVDERGTLPHVAQSLPEARTIRYDAEDRATRIAGIIIAWNILEHFYPYFDVVTTDWPKALKAGLRSAAVGSAKDYLVTLRLLMAALKDGHAGVTPSEGGVGAPVAWDWIEDRLVITYVPDAQGQQVAAGDTVLSIDGKPVAKALAEAEALRSGATPQWIRYRALAELSLGPPDRPLVLEIEPLRDPSSRHAVTLNRSASGKSVADPRPEKIAELKPGIYYVDLTRINDSEWAAALPKLESSSGIIFDLRGYPSLGPDWLNHLSLTAMTSAQWHIPVVTQPDRNNMAFERGGEWNLQPAKPYLKAKRAVLTNGSAISYAESVMGIVEHYKLAEIAGSTTAGTNGNVNQFRIPGGYTLWWTGMKVLKHDGSQHHGIGIKPTIPVTRTRAGVAAGRDEVLERGIHAVE